MVQGVSPGIVHCLSEEEKAVKGENLSGAWHSPLTATKNPQFSAGFLLVYQIMLFRGVFARLFCSLFCRSGSSRGQNGHNLFAFHAWF